MSNVPAELKYSKEHEWLRKEADSTPPVASPGRTPRAVRRYGVC